MPPPCAPGGPRVRSISVPDSWATSGVDLHLDLAGSRGRLALERALREAVRSGRLRPGTRLPSSRALAADLRIARNTVAETYGQLVAEGWLVARQGSGTRVAERVAAPSRRRRPRSPRPRPGTACGRARRTSARSPVRRGPPRCAGRWPRRRPVRSATPTRVAGPSCAGRWPATWPGPAACTPTPGGSWCAPASPRASGCSARRCGAAARRRWPPRRTGCPAPGARRRARAGAADRAGGRARRRCRRPGADAVLLTPAHQFPLGGVLAPAPAAGAVEWARADALVIEDDYDGEFRYDRQPVGALQGLAPDRVVYAGTASKTLAPGLRLGWLVLPAHLVDRWSPPRGGADRHSGVLDQLDAGGVRHQRRVRPARPRSPAGVPAAARPAGRRAAPARPAGPGDRRGGRPARAGRAAARPHRGVGRRAAARRGLALEPLGDYATPGAAIRRRSWSGTPPRRSTGSRPRSTCSARCSASSACGGSRGAAQLALLAADRVVQHQEREAEHRERVLGPQLAAVDVHVELLGEAGHGQRGELRLRGST